MMMVNRGPVSIIGSGGNINKLYRLVPKKVRRDNRLSLTPLEQLYDKLSSLSFEERMKQFDLRSSRADVIVPAAQIFISIARAVKATEIIVPTVEPCRRHHQGTLHKDTDQGGRREID